MLRLVGLTKISMKLCEAGGRLGWWNAFKLPAIFEIVYSEADKKNKHMKILLEKITRKNHIVRKNKPHNKTKHGIQSKASLYI